jgi:hypothetical protein
MEPISSTSNTLYFIVNSWNTDSNKTTHSKISLFLTYDDAINFYNIAISKKPDLTDSSIPLLHFHSKNDIYDYPLDFDVSDIYRCEINQIIDGVLVYKERFTKGYFKRHSGVILIPIYPTSTYSFTINPN